MRTHHLHGVPLILLSNLGCTNSAPLSTQGELRATRAHAQDHLTGRKQAQESLVHALRTHKQVLQAWMAREEELKRKALEDHARHQSVLNCLRSQSI